MPLQMHLCSRFQQPPTPCSPVFTQPPPCRSFQSDEDTPPSACTPIGPELLSMSRTTANPYHLFLHQTCAPQILWTSQQLPITEKPWNSISMDFIEKLPLSSGYTSILVIVDCLSKQSLFISTYNTITPPQLAQLFVLHVFSKNSVPSHITSNQGT